MGCERKALKRFAVELSKFVGSCEVGMGCERQALKRFAVVELRFAVVEWLRFAVELSKLLGDDVDMVAVGLGWRCMGRH